MPEHRLVVTYTISEFEKTVNCLFEDGWIAAPNVHIALTGVSGSVYMIVLERKQNVK